MEPKAAPTERVHELKSVGARIEGQGQIPTARRDKKSERHVHPRNHQPKGNTMSDPQTQQHEGNKNKHRDDVAREPRTDAEPNGSDPVVARMNNVDHNVRLLLENMVEEKTATGRFKTAALAAGAAAIGAGVATAGVTWLMRSKVLPPAPVDAAMPIPGMKK
jgi:hypothetical protein